MTMRMRRIFYTTLRSESDNFLINNGLEHAAGFCSQLSHRLKLRVVLAPFVYDQSIERVRLSQLIDEAVALKGSSSEPDES